MSVLPRDSFVLGILATVIAVHGEPGPGHSRAPARADEPGPDTWPTLHRDYQRSGFTPHVVEGPFERKWYRDFHGEMVATRVEAIVAEGKVFIGTFAGNLHALNVADGSTAWKFRAGGAIGTSPCYAGGKLFIGDDSGHLHCVRAADGQRLWHYEAGASVWTSPACDGARVYVGDRSGVFHAVHAAGGSKAWSFQTDYMVLTPASFSTDRQRIVFGSEDMHVYCLNPKGELLWKSEKLPGLSLRDHAPTIWNDLAIVRTNPADGFHQVMNRQGEVLEKIQRAIPLGDNDDVLLEKWGDYIVAPTPRRRRAEQQGVVEYLRENPEEQTFFALRLDDGRKPWIAPIFYTGGLHNPPTAPTFHPQSGELYTLYRTAMTSYLRGVRRYSGLVRLDPESGRITFSWPEPAHEIEERNWYGIPMIGDETQALSRMGPWLIFTHQGEIGALHLKTHEVQRIWRGRDTYGGIFGPGAVEGKFDGARALARKGYLTGMPNEWHGPDRAIAAMAADRIFWVTGSQVVCLGGPDVPATPSGGTEPPPLIRNRLGIAGGNVAGDRPRDPFDGSLEKRTVTAEEMLEWIHREPPEHSRVDAAKGDALAGAVRDRLEEEVLELIRPQPGWAPLLIELGISGVERHFCKTGETMQILSLALPYLSREVRQRAKSYLDSLFTAGAPFKKPVFTGPGLARREPFDLAGELRDHAARPKRYKAGIKDLYAVWAYAHHAGAWDVVLPRKERYREVFDGFTSTAFTFRHTDIDPEDRKGRDRGRDLAEHLNARIAGVLAFGRILARAGETREVRRAAERLAEMVTERIHHERADRWFIRRTKVASHRLHQAKIPRYLALTPELGAMLDEYAGDAVRRNVNRLQQQLPVWHHAYGERLIGGENYISPPHLSRALFMAAADAARFKPDALRERLDQPWGQADLYYIEKLTATLRAAYRAYQ